MVSRLQPVARAKSPRRIDLTLLLLIVPRNPLSLYQLQTLERWKHLFKEDSMEQHLAELPQSQSQKTGDETTKGWGVTGLGVSVRWR